MNTTYVLKKLWQVLESPSPDGPLNAAAGEMLAKDAAKFKETAAKWTGAP